MKASLHWAIYAGAAVIGIGVGLWSKGAPAARSEVVFLSVGQGDCTLVTSEGRAALIDAGPKKLNDDAGAKIVVPDLRKWGISRLDWILLSHPDIDHVGGLKSVLKAFPHAQVIMSKVYENDPKMDSELAAAGLQPKDVNWVTSIDGQLGVFKMEVRCPPWDPSSDDNLGCMFVHLADGRAALTTSGDAPMAVERAMIPVLDWKAELLHLGHHGSRTSTSSEWLAAVQPDTAIASCGLNNEYGHPHRETVNRVKAAGITLLRTDKDGDLFFRDEDGHFVRKSQF